MMKALFLGTVVAVAMIGSVSADPVDLTAYVDANGFIDVQTLTCGQLANTYQEDANALMSWYSGWYNGLAGYGKINVERAKEMEHRVIVYCKANPGKKVIQAIDVVIKGYRKEKGIKVKDEQ